MVNQDATASPTASRPGRLADNVVHFTRVLRQAGLPVGSEHTLAALRALEIIGFDSKEHVHAALSAVLIDRREHQAIFDSAFAAFWKDPKMLERLMYLTLPKVTGRVEQRREDQHRRLDEALSGVRPGDALKPNPAEEEADQVNIDASLTYSEQEKLQAMDFESMSIDEFNDAKKLAAQLPLMLRPVPVRRLERANRGSLDLAAMLRSTARTPLAMPLLYQRNRIQPPPLIILCDISGSMQRYSRIFLYWAHALTRNFARVETLTLGTRLTRITRMLQTRDVDDAVRDAGNKVSDWSGGTRLGPCLREFNRQWARRLLVGNASVLLLSDGLDRDDAGELSREAARLKSFAHRVIWLNPLLRFDGFEPKAAGVRALLPHVDDFVPAHNLRSLKDLSKTLATARSNPQRFNAGMLKS
jgi:uncharacterized protein